MRALARSFSLLTTWPLPVGLALPHLACRPLRPARCLSLPLLNFELAHAGPLLANLVVPGSNTVGLSLETVPGEPLQVRQLRT